MQGAQLASEASYQQTEVVTVPGLRGTMLDRHGQALAASEDAVTIFATPYQVKKPDQTAEKLAQHPRRRPGRRAQEPDRRIGLLLPRQEGRPCRPRRGSNGSNCPGSASFPTRRRTYPQGDIAGQVIGAVGSENEGPDRARGRARTRSSPAPTANATSSKTRSANRSGSKRSPKPRTATDIQLTLDPAIEAKTEQVLAEVGETYSPKGATAIVVDPRSSQILAMANWPPVNPADLSAASPEDLLNRATGFTYEPGSTFKAFTVSAALEEKEVTPDTTFTLPPQLQVADRTIEDAEPRGTVTLSVAEILSHSSNVGAVTIGLQMGADKFSRWINRFGFGRPTGVQYPGEEQGLVPPLDEYSGSTMGNLPIGPGPLGDADADGRRLHGDRQRRHAQTRRS